MRSTRVAMMTVAVVALVGAAARAEVTLAPEDRSALEVTIYNNGLALVRDRRTASLPQGLQRIRFAGVSRQMIPSSAFLSAPGGEPIAVQDIDYQFDLLTPEALLQRSVGSEVGVIRTHPTTGEETVERAQVLSAENGVVLRYRDRIETGVPGRLVFDSVPPGLHPRPTLTATIESREQAPSQLELTYLTNGLTWEADYIVELDEAGDRLDLTARATLQNVSGTEFPAASVALMAGEVARDQTPMPPVPMPRAAKADAMMAAEAPERMAREEVGGMHLYTVGRPVSLDDRETKQVALLATADVPVTRQYVSESSAPVFYASRGRPEPEQAMIRLRFRNGPDVGPGEPLPAGLVRVYTRDEGGALRFLGEQRISHVPVGQDVELTPGRAFDVTVLREQTDLQQAGMAKNVFESAYRITVANAKDEPVTVKVVEVIPGDWTIIEQSQPHEKESADRAVWTVDVPAAGETQVTYRVRVQR